MPSDQLCDHGFMKSPSEKYCPGCPSCAWSEVLRLRAELTAARTANAVLEVAYRAVFDERDALRQELASRPKCPFCTPRPRPMESVVYTGPEAEVLS